MSRGFNKVIIVGNLGVDPEVRYLPDGSPVANIRVATSEVWKDRQNGERQERTEWHRIVLFKRLGEIAAQYLKKGSRVLVEGSIRTKKWQDQSGNERFTTEIIASNLQLMDSKAGAGTPDYMSEAPQDASGYTGDSAPNASRPTAAKATATTLSEEEFDDDIPF